RRSQHAGVPFPGLSWRRELGSRPAGPALRQARRHDLARLLDRGRRLWPLDRVFRAVALAARIRLQLAAPAQPRDLFILGVTSDPREVCMLPELWEWRAALAIKREQPRALKLEQTPRITLELDHTANGRSVMLNRRTLLILCASGAFITAGTTALA